MLARLDHQKFGWNRAHDIDVILGLQRAAVYTNKISQVGEHFSLLVRSRKRVNLQVLYTYYAMC